MYKLRAGALAFLSHLVSFFVSIVFSHFFLERARSKLPLPAIRQYPRCINGREHRRRPALLAERTYGRVQPRAGKVKRG